MEVIRSQMWGQKIILTAGDRQKERPEVGNYKRGVCNSLRGNK